MENAIIDHSLTLQCTVTTVTDINSRVDIVWSTGNTQVRRVNNVPASDIITLTAYEDTFVTPPLDISDIGSVYQCKVIINSSPPTMAQDDFTIPFPGMRIFSIVYYLCNLLIMKVFNQSQSEVKFCV